MLYLPAHLKAMNISPCHAFEVRKDYCLTSFSVYDIILKGQKINNY
jgi:hypothetical protein